MSDNIKTAQENEFNAIMKHINDAALKGEFRIFLEGQLSKDTKQDLSTLNYIVEPYRTGYRISWEHLPITKLNQ